MVSKTVLARQKIQEDQAAWVSTNAPALATKLGKVVGKVESVEELILALSRLVEKRAKAMADADAAHTLELADDAAPRLARDTAAEAVSGELQFARSSISTIYGPRALVAVGLAEVLSRDPVAIEAMAKLFVKSVEAPSFAMPPPKSRAARTSRGPTGAASSSCSRRPQPRTRLEPRAGATHDYDQEQPERHRRHHPHHHRAHGQRPEEPGP
jgi:hypothetical protein